MRIGELTSEEVAALAVAFEGEAERLREPRDPAAYAAFDRRADEVVRRLEAERRLDEDTLIAGRRSYLQPFGSESAHVPGGKRGTAWTQLIEPPQRNVQAGETALARVRRARDAVDQARVRSVLEAVNGDYDVAISNPRGSALLVLARQLSNASMETMNTRYLTAFGSSEGAALLATSISLTNEGVGAMNTRSRDANGAGLASALLAHISVTANHPDVQTVNAIYERAAGTRFTRSARAILTGLAVRSNMPIDRLNTMYAAAADTGLTGALLVYAAVTSGKSIADVNTMYQVASARGEAGALLVLAAVRSGQSIAALNEHYGSARGTGRTAALLVLTNALTGLPIDTINVAYDGAHSVAEPGALLALTAATKLTDASLPVEDVLAAVVVAYQGAIDDEKQEERRRP